MTDRKPNEARWVGALERTDVPLAFVWGMLDRVSGAHMAERITERLPGAAVHCPDRRLPLADARGATALTAAILRA
jgi:pimeloyl-ACP methyl ester carboxylesterase